MFGILPPTRKTEIIFKMDTFQVLKDSVEGQRPTYRWQEVKDNKLSEFGPFLDLETVFLSYDLMKKGPIVVKPKILENLVQVDFYLKKRI